jgi:ubiquinone/menaquinone biosynthesis C-methylase UbiE
MSEDYKEILERQMKNSNLKVQKIYYTNLYKKIETYIKDNDKVLEIGAGAGISRNFLKKSNIVRTDYLNWDKKFDVIGDIDAGDLPYEDNSFDVIFGVDMFHHVNNQFQVLQESIRVTKNNGKIILIEPYVSPFSYIVYKIFHHENTTYTYNFLEEYNLSNPQEGDQGIAKSIFSKNQGKLHLQKNNIKSNNVMVKLIHPFSFFATGGLSKPIKSNSTLIKILLKIENFIPSILMKILASRMLISIVVIK